MFGVCGECDRVVRNVMEGMEPSRMSRNGAGVSEMDLAKFYVTFLYVTVGYLLQVIR